MLYDLPAPAKLNLFLHVVGRRADGYHLLQTVMRFIDLMDTLSFDPRSDGRLTCENSQNIAPQEDLVLRAARRLQQASGTRLGVHIVCKKRIPAGTGLGGGSSDAATTLIALNRLWQTGLSRDEMMRLGAALGADVPLFLFGQTAFVEGIGERLTAVDGLTLSAQDSAYLLVQPEAFVSTAAVFTAPDLTSDTETVRIADFTEWYTASEVSGPKALFGRNDLEAVVLAQYRPVWLARSTLLAQGWQNVRMTGSGACFFVPCADMRQAFARKRTIAAKMAQCDDADNKAHGIKQIWACAGLAEHPLVHW